jgi:hypothetical protein
MVFPWVLMSEYRTVPQWVELRVHWKALQTAKSMGYQMVICLAALKAQN